jgi:hypothetical protein
MKEDIPVEFLLNDEDYTPPDRSAVTEPLDQDAYLKGHRAGWLALQ